MARVGKRKKMLRGVSECAYCGKVPAETVDHVVPKCLFGTPLPTNMITVPACSRCNGAKSRLDSLLRDFLVCEEGRPPHQVADSLRAGPYKRAVARKQSEFWKEIDAGRFKRHNLSLNGFDLGQFLEVPFGNGPVKESITYIVRGLYYRMLKQRLPDDHTFLVGGLRDRDTCIQMLQRLQSIGPIGIAAIGDDRKFDVFSSFCATFYTAEDEKFAGSVWGLAFYERMHIGCTTVDKTRSSLLNPKYFEMF